MGILLRAAIMLGVAVPVFAATGFHLALWQIFVAAVIGSTAGQLAWKATQARSRAVQLAVTALGIVVAAGGAMAFYPRRLLTQAPTHTGLFVVANGKPPSLTLGDLDALTANVGAIAPLAHHVAQLVTDDANWQSEVHGTTPAYFDLRGWRLASGTLFTQADLETRAKVVVLGPTTANQLFGRADPVGRIIRIQNAPFTIAGVLAPKGADDDDVAIVPLTTFLAKIRPGMGKTFDGVFLISAAAPESIRSILRDRHRLAPGDNDDFIVREAP
jgi:hypothetical protein